MSGPPEATTEIKPAGRDVELFNDHIYCELRAFAQVPHDFVNTGWDLDTLKPGGGKGGTLMAKVGTTYIVKELSLGDHKTLVSIAGSYGQHVRSGQTLLCPVYLHFRDKATGRFFFTMRNGIGEGPFRGLYDLKGCADDKTLEKDGETVRTAHKRLWNVSMWVGKVSWSEKRKIYHAGKKAARILDIEVTPDQRTKLVECMQRDTAWLAANQLMDYSLLVAIKDAPEAVTASGVSGPSSLAAPMIRKNPDGSTTVLLVSIIDYLQKWTNGKRIARVIKCAETNKATVPPAYYGQRFLKHFSSRMKPSGTAPAPPTLPAPVGSSVQSAVMVAPPAGDDEEVGGPEDRLNSRPMPADREPSRPVPEPQATVNEPGLTSL